jgi:hypothetical protein
MELEDYLRQKHKKHEQFAAKSSSASALSPSYRSWTDSSSDDDLNSPTWVS